MINEHTIAALYEAAKHGAVANLERGKPLKPIALVIEPDSNVKCIAIDVRADDEDVERDRMRTVLDTLVRRYPVCAIVIECWMASVPQSEFDSGHVTPASERSDRREVVMVNLFVNGARECTAVKEFTRKDGRVTQLDWIETSADHDFVSTTEHGSIFPG